MWGAFVSDDNASRALSLAFRLTLHQHRHPPSQHVDLAGLACDHVAQLVHGTHQMRQFFFQLQHTPPIPHPAVPAKPFLSGGRLRRPHEALRVLADARWRQARRRFGPVPALLLLSLSKYPFHAGQAGPTPQRLAPPPPFS